MVCPTEMTPIPASTRLAETLVRACRTSVRTMLLCGAMLAAVPQPASAQISSASQARLPSDSLLSRAGLTRAWWGQAVTNARRDRMQYLTADESAVYTQTSSGLITAFHAETGKRLWGTQIGQADRPTYPLTIDAGRLLVVNGTQLNSIDQATGDVAWTMNLPGQPTSSASSKGGTAFVGFLDGSMFAFDTQVAQNLADKNRLLDWGHLTVLWRYKTSAAIEAPAIVTDKYVAFASHNGTMYSVTKRERELLFQFETDARLSAPPVIYEDSLLVASEDFKVYSVGIRNGRYNWQYSSGGPLLVPPLIVGKDAYITPENTGLIVLDAGTGVEKWTRPGVHRVLSVSPARVYGYDRMNNLLVIDRATGAFIASARMEPYHYFVANDRSDRIYVASESGLVISLREIEREFPLLHRQPEKQPILPEVGPENGAAAPSDGQGEAMPLDESKPASEEEMPADSPAETN